MAQLSNEQLEFIRRQRISLSRVFDATGLSVHRYKRMMRELGMVIAYGVSPCRAAGHTLRTRAGHCVQCGTHHLAFLQRHEDAGAVYIATSKSGRLLKIGTAQNTYEREASLNKFGYAGSNDWKIKAVWRCDQAGRVEFLAQEALWQYRESRQYVKQGAIVNCYELFQCSVKKAEKAVQSALVQMEEMGYYKS